MTDPISVYSWNPRRRARIRGLRWLRLPGTINNFGDLVGPVVVDEMLRTRHLTAPTRPAPSHSGAPTKTLFSVGSVLHEAVDGDTVWGSGINGKIAPEAHRWSSLDFRAVRGPLSREWIHRVKGVEVPEVYGDPALLLFELGHPRPNRELRRSLTFIPNLNDKRLHLAASHKVSPREPLAEILEAIATSEFLVTSSLHALVFAELLEVPVALVRSPHEPSFKYLDYAQGTGRHDLTFFDTPGEAATALRNGSARSSESPLAGWDPRPLISAFPVDLFDAF